MVTLQDIPTPFFVVNQNVFVKNCQRALEYCECNSIRMRPHIKTHKTLQGAWIQAYGQPRNQRNEVDGGVVSPTENNGTLTVKSWSSPLLWYDTKSYRIAYFHLSFLDLGGPDDKRLKSPLVTGFVASTIAEVRLLAESGLGGPFDDILYGVPIASTSKIAILDQIQQRHANVTIHLFVDHPRQVQMLDDYCISTSRKHPFSIFLKLDTGYHRAGVSCDDRGVDLASQIVLSDQLVLKGVYSHWYVMDVVSNLVCYWCSLPIHHFFILLLWLFQRGCFNSIVDTPMTATIPRRTRKLPKPTWLASNRFCNRSNWNWRKQASLCLTW